jgi:hypothetical protein
MELPEDRGRYRVSALRCQIFDTRIRTNAVLSLIAHVIELTPQGLIGFRIADRVRDRRVSDLARRGQQLAVHV